MFAWLSLDAKVRDIRRGLFHEEVAEDQGAEHFKGINTLLGASLVKHPKVSSWSDLVIQPEDVALHCGFQVGEPTTNEGRGIIRGTCTSLAPVQMAMRA